MRRGRKTSGELAAERGALEGGRAEAPEKPARGARHPPTPPAHLRSQPRVARHFRRVAYHIHKRPGWQTVDVPVLVRYATVLVRLEQLAAELSVRGPVDLGGRSGSRRVPSELLRYELRYQKEARELEEQLGIGERNRRRKPAEAEEDTADARDADPAASLGFGIAL